jgi:PAS domain S-box-containing protein
MRVSQRQDVGSVLGQRQCTINVRNRTKSDKLILLSPCFHTESVGLAMANIAKKSSEQNEAEDEVKDFADDLGPFVVAVKETRMAMVFTDAMETDNPIIFANDSFLRMTGFERREVLGQSFNFLISQAGDEEALATIHAEFAEDSKGGSEVLYSRKDGSQFWAAIFISPVRDEEGSIVQYFASFVDLSKHKKEQAQSRMLIDELNHRVKNTLATVQSIVWQALRTDADRKSLREAIESRLFALSRSHDLLTLRNWESASLWDLVHQGIAPFSLDNEHAERILMSGPDIRLPPKVALALGIAFNELATNAAKYGALSNEAGRLKIAWKIVGKASERQLDISWSESGGPPVSIPKRKGFGSKVLQRGLALELGAVVELEYPPGGVQCSINIPHPGDHDE